MNLWPKKARKIGKLLQQTLINVSISSWDAVSLVLINSGWSFNLGHHQSACEIYHYDVKYLTAISGLASLNTVRRKEYHPTEDLC